MYTHPSCARGAPLIAALLFVSASPRPAQAQDPAASLSKADKRRLLELVKQGEQAYEAGKLREASEAYQAALRLAPVGGVYYRLALCHERLDEPEAAAQAYRRYLELVPDAQNRGRVEADIARLNALVAQRRVGALALTSEPAGAEVVTSDGQRLGVTPLEVTLVPGTYTLTLTAPGYRPQEAEVAVEAGGATRLNLALVRRSVLSVTTRPAGATVRDGGPQGAVLGVTPLELEREPGAWRLHVTAPGHDAALIAGELGAGESARVERALAPSVEPAPGWAAPVGWGLTGLGVASAATSVVLWVMASGAHDDALAAYEDPAKRRDGTYAGLKADAEGLATWTQVTAVAGAVLVVGGATVLLVMSPGAPAEQSLIASPAQAPTVQVRWRF